MTTEKSTSRAIRARRKEPFFVRMDMLVQMCGSASELARLAGVSESAIRKWKAGDSEPTVDRLVRLARATGVDVGWLATGQGAQEGGSAGDAMHDHRAVYGGTAGFSLEDVEGVVLLVERHPATRDMPAEEKAAYIRDLLEWESRRRHVDKQDTQEMLKDGPPE